VSSVALEILAMGVLAAPEAPWGALIGADFHTLPGFSSAGLGYYRPLPIASIILSHHSLFPQGLLVFTIRAAPALPTSAS